jgi:hypothetical protein
MACQVNLHIKVLLFASGYGPYGLLAGSSAAYFGYPPAVCPPTYLQSAAMGGITEEIQGLIFLASSLCSFLALKFFVCTGILFAWLLYGPSTHIGY